MFNYIANKLTGKAPEETPVEAKQTQLQGSGPYRTPASLPDTNHLDMQPVFQRYHILEHRDTLVSSMHSAEQDDLLVKAAAIAEALEFRDEAIRLYLKIQEERKGSDLYLAKSRLAHFAGDTEKEDEYRNIHVALWNIVGGEAMR